MLLVDTNVFLGLFLGQKRAEECEKFLQKISDGEFEAVVSRFTIHAIEAILNNSGLILVFLGNVQGSLGLNCMRRAWRKRWLLPCLRVK